MRKILGEGLPPWDPKDRKKPYTRIEISETETDKVQIAKYRQGWTASSHPDTWYITDEKSFDEMVAWLDENGWTHREWYNPARGRRCRAFLGAPEPVRVREDIHQFRTLVSMGKIRVPNVQDDLGCWYDFYPLLRHEFQRLISGEKDVQAAG